MMNVNNISQPCNHRPTEIVIENINMNVFTSIDQIFYALRQMHIGIITDIIQLSTIPLFVPYGPPIPTLQVKVCFKQWNLLPTREMRRLFESGLRVSRNMPGSEWYMTDVKQQCLIYMQKQREYELRCLQEDEESRIMYYPSKKTDIMSCRNPRSRRLGRDYRASEAEMCEMGEVYCNNNNDHVDCHTVNSGDIVPEQINIVINV